MALNTTSSDGGVFRQTITDTLLQQLTDNSSISENHTTTNNDTLFPTTVSKPITITSSIVQLFIVPIILSGNIMILWAIKRSRSLHQVTYYLLGNLAVADILFGFAMGFRSILTLMNKLGVYECLLTNNLVLVSGASSLSGVLLLCLQSFLSVKFVVHFKTGFTTKVAGGLMLSTWLFWIVYVSMAIVSADTREEAPGNQCYIGNQYYHKTFLITLSFLGMLQLIFLMLLQGATLFLIRQQKKNLHHQVQGVNPQQMSTVAHTAMGLNKLKRMAGITRIISLVLILTLLCWGPFIVGLTIFSLCPVGCGMTGQRLSLLSTVVIINSLANVIIYSLKSKEFRKAFAQICKCQQHVADSASSTSA